MLYKGTHGSAHTRTLIVSRKPPKIEFARKRIAGAQRALNTIIFYLILQLEGTLKSRVFAALTVGCNSPKGQSMFAVGHLALGYLTGRAASKILNVDLNVPLLFLFSILPDVDLIIPGLQHRGATHSIVVCMIVFLPALIVYKKRAMPYFVSAAQHSLLGDFLTGGGVQILWPITSNWYGIGVEMIGLTNIYLEWASFLASLTIMLKTKDMIMLFQHHPSNLLLTVPVFAIILPSFLSFPLAVPLELVAPHLVFLALLALSIFTDLKPYFDRWFWRKP